MRHPSTKSVMIVRNPVIDGIKDLVISGGLYRAIRGEVFILKTPPEINSEMQPTDHSELLKMGVYLLCNELGVDNVLHALECGLRRAASDAIGVFCAIQCYYVQIISEMHKQSLFRVDRVDLPQFLGLQFRKYEKDFIEIRLNSYDPLNAALLLTLAAIGTLRRNFGIDFGEFG